MLSSLFDVHYPLTIYGLKTQSLNVIESPKLRAIFLMLREQLVEANIPSRTTIRARIIEMWHEHLNSLEERMLVSTNVLSTTLQI